MIIYSRLTITNVLSFQPRIDGHSVEKHSALLVHDWFSFFQVLSTHIILCLVAWRLCNNWSSILLFNVQRFNDGPLFLLRLAFYIISFSDYIYIERKRDGKGNETSDKVMRYALLELGLDHTLKSTTIGSNATYRDQRSFMSHDHMTIFFFLHFLFSTILWL